MRFLPAFAALMLASGAGAEPTVYTCRFLQGDAGRETDINQLRVDLDAPSFELLDTIARDGWSYLNRRDEISDDIASVQRDPNGNLAMVAIRLRIPVHAALDQRTGRLVYAYISGVRSYRFEYQCDEQ